MRISNLCHFDEIRNIDECSRTVEQVKQSVLEALKRVSQKDSSIKLKPNSISIIANPNGLQSSVQFMVTKDSELIDDALKQFFPAVYDMGCSETDHLPGDAENFPTPEGFHEWVCTVSDNSLRFV